jgi:phosphate transport system protein
MPWMASEAATKVEQAERIRSLFLQMCVRAESQVRLAIRSLFDRDPHLGRIVVASDDAIDSLELEIDRRCLALIAGNQPQGRDLRTVTATMKMVTDLERMGDLAVNIAQRGLELTASPGMEPSPALAAMAEEAADMVRLAAQAYVNEDADVARAVIARDAHVDQLHRSVFERLVVAMNEHPDQVDRALALTSISKYVERVGDHATNVAEMIVFLLEGHDMRHSRNSG